MRSSILVLGGFGLIVLGVLEVGLHNYHSALTGTIVIGLGFVCQEINNIGDNQ